MYIRFFIAPFLITYTLISNNFWHKLDCALQQAVTQKIFPGAVALVGHHHAIVYHKAYGHYTYDPTSTQISCDTLFDIASLTKVVATTTLAMILCDQKLLTLDNAVCSYLPEFGQSGKSTICIKHLLTHTSGLDAGADFYPPGSTAQAVIALLMACSTQYPAGTTYIYSDIGMVILQKVIETITGTNFSENVYQLITQPLQMHATCFNPAQQKQCAPTGYLLNRMGLIQGQVHDTKAYLLGGVAGHAGLFSTADNLARFMFMLLNDGQPLIKQETVRSWTKDVTGFKRGYGWEIGRHLGPDAFGHFGWTGTSIWADYDRSLFCILLTNCTYCEPYEQIDRHNIAEFRIKFHHLVEEIIEGFDEARKKSEAYK